MKVKYLKKYKTYSRRIKINGVSVEIWSKDKKHLEEVPYNLESKRKDKK